MSTYSFELIPGTLTLAQTRAISRNSVKLTLAKEAIKDINQSAEIVQQVLREGRTVYGINTGFGLLANTKIVPEDLQLLQRSIVLSHAAGIGKYMQDATVRLMMVLKINSLIRGFRYPFRGYRVSHSASECRSVSVCARKRLSRGIG